MKNARGPGQRAGLSQEAVIAASWELLDAADDVSALTMRALARHLEVAPNALYSHVANRTALLDLLLDDLLAAIPVPSRDAGDPTTTLTNLMTATYRTLTARPALVPSYLARQGARGPHALRLGEAMDDLLARTGIAASDVASVRRALIIHAIGSAAFATGASDTSTADRLLSQEQSRNAFDRSLRWLLAGAVGDARES